ncbi:MAG: DUF1501 domain-containing protein [Planctomycetes bacterium]|nr:DUF1501 domain-containing protein [Planctomycetota bacterium]
MKSTRRELLQQAGLGVLAAGAASQWNLSRAAAPIAKGPTPTLVAVYLRGGADTLSAVVPYSDKDYPRHRPTIAMQATGGASATAVHPLDDTWAFNPNMKDLHSMYEAGLVAPIVAAGSPHDTRSHFDAQDFMERGAPGQKNVMTGWLNRYLTETKTSKDANLRAVSLQPLLPRSLRGSYPVLARPDQKADQAMAVYSQLYLQQQQQSGRANRPKPGAASSTRAAVEEFGARTIEQLYELNAILEQPAPQGIRYPESGFGRALRDVAKLVKAKRGLEVTGVDIGGWDHHIDEGPATGQMGRKLKDVSESIAAFAQDLGPEQLKHTLILVMSEFGRTVKENDNRGTDHGHGGFMLAIGGMIREKKVYGKWTGLADDQLYQRRDVPVTTDFRAVFAEAIKRLFQFDPFEENRMFPGYDAEMYAEGELNYLRDPA